MKSEWKTKQLSDIADFNPRESLSKGIEAKKISMDMLQPYCRDVPTYEVTAFTGGTKFRNGDTIMARITPCLENGKTAQINILDDNEVGFGSTEYIVIRAKEGVSDPDYIYYLVRSPLVREPAIKSMVGSSGRQRVQTDVVQRLEVQVPPLEEQRKVSGVLRVLDDKIKLNNEINKNLLRQAQAIYREMFVNATNDQRQTCRAEEYFDIAIGKTPPRKEHQWFTTDPSDVTWVSISDMGSCGTYIRRSSEQLTQEAVDKFNIRVIPSNTVLLSFKLTVGRIAITYGEMTTNEAIAHFKTDKTFINEYLYCYLKDFNYQTMGSTSSIATAVNSKIIKAMPFVIPTDDEISRFHTVVGPMFEQILNNQLENDSLAEMRDALIPRLMSGELNVSNLDL
jgi:type I restriction enzyme S subunit